MSGLSFGGQGRKTIADIVDLNSATASASKSAGDASMNKALDSLNFGLSVSRQKAQLVPFILQQGEQSLTAAMVNKATDDLAQMKALVEMLSGRAPAQPTAPQQDQAAQPAGK